MNRTLKRISFLILLAVMTVFCCTGAAEESAVIASGSCGTNVKWALDDAGTLTISGTGEMSSRPWSSYTDSIFSVIIENGVTSIYNYAFFNIKSLQSISIPDSVVSIKERAFMNCTSLSSVVIPKGVTSIGWYAFDGCTGLTSVSLPDSIISIEESVFRGCTSLTEVHIPKLKSWLNIAFKNPESNPTYYAGKLYADDQLLTRLVVPADVSIISKYAFYNCSSIVSVSIPDSVISIGSAAFYGCSALESISIPNSITSLPSDAFTGCSNISSASIPGFVISGGTSSLSNGTFGYYFGTNIQEAVILDGCTTIGDYAFSGCSGLSSISIPESVVSIGNRAFNNCSSLSSIVMPNSVGSIGNYAFYNCSSLASVSMPSTLNSIGDYSFLNCSALSSILIPESVTSIGSYAFSGCSLLSSILLPDGITSISKNTFEGCTALSSIHIPDSVISIGDYAFCECIRLTKVNLPTNVTTLGSYAFHGCSALQTIHIPDRLRSIGSSAFGRCSALQSIYLPRTLTSISSKTFSYCSSLSSIIIPDSIASIGSSAFEFCSALTSLVIPASVSFIGSDAFYFCTNLNHLTFQGDIPSITSSPFKYQMKNVAILGSGVAENTEGIFSSSTNIYCYEYTAVDFWAAEQGYKITYLDGNSIPSSFSLPENKLLPSGTSERILVQAFPVYQDPPITWSSSAPEIASVDDGVLTAHSSGTALITAVCGSHSDSMNVTVYTPVSSFDLSAQELYIASKQTAQLSAQNIQPENADMVFTWETSDSTIASVSETGLITAKAPGDTVITATADSGFSQRCSIHVRLPLTSMTISPADSRIGLYALQPLVISSMPVTQYPSRLLASFVSSNPSVASIDENGIILGVGAGTATITAASINGITAQCTVTVEHRNMLTLPSSLRSIGAEAFENTAAEAVILPSSCTSIASRAFANAGDIALYMPDSVTDIAGDAFDRCGKVAFICESDNAAAAYAKEKGFTYRIEQLQ